MALENAIKNAFELQRHSLNFHPYLLEIVLDESCHLAALGVRGAGENSEFNRGAGSIEQRTGGVPGESGIAKKLFGVLHRTRRLRQRRIQP